MELKAWERIRLLSILPEKGSFINLKIVQNLKMRLSFSEEEQARLQFKDDGEKLMWNPDADVPKEFHFGPKTKELIVAELKKLDKGNALDIQLMDLFEKFCATTEYSLEGELETVPPRA
jgi:hypothetical protein